MMKIIQSFWTGDRDALHSSYGWLTPMDHYLSWILSCNQLRKQYDQVCLVTDQQGYEILVEGLSLPYTEVKICLDTLNGYNPNLWALAKIKAYSIQKEPFVHVDGDVFEGHRSSRAREFHPHPLTEPCVKVSPHTALHTQLFVHRHNLEV